MKDLLPDLIILAGWAQLSVLAASALVPFRLEWKSALAGLPRLHRQVYWIYGGYVVLAIVGNGLLCIVHADRLASGDLLARSLCGYLAVFWGIRLSLQATLDVRTFLVSWWLRLGYHVLTLLFFSFTLVFGYAAIR